MTQIWKCGFCNVKEMQGGTLNNHKGDVGVILRINFVLLA